MTPIWRRCGHPKTDDNAIGLTVLQCRTCHDERIAAKKAATAARNDAIVTDFEAGENVGILASRHGLSRSRIWDIIRERRGKTAEIYSDPLFPDRAIKVAAELAGANVAQLCSEWRAPRELVHARWAFMAALRRRGVVTPSIGRRLNRDHSTVVYGLKQAKLLAARSPEFAEMMAKVDAA